MASLLNGTKPSGVTMAQLEELVRVIRMTPIIDNHAHPLLKDEELGKHPLMAITTEAHGDAIHDAPTSLAHHRAVQQLSRVLGCAATWEAVVAAVEQRRIDSHADWIAECLAGIETLLVDDGLDAADDVQGYAWHDDYVRSPCKRIVRIEQVAKDVINRHAAAQHDVGTSKSTDALFAAVMADFDAQVKAAVEDPEVVGFKSVICYRTGLDVPRVADVELARAAFAGIMAKQAVGVPLERVQHDGLNDLLVHRTACLIRDSASRFKKPFQFHTGLGDSDITLARASPSHLQQFIRAYPEVPIVLLHASYPFTQEAGYLATVYANVYADIGEIFPFVSQEGQEMCVRQILELCPWSKVLWSTDGHWFPETYMLAVSQMREVLETVLCDYVRKGYISYKAAIEMVRAVLFHNSNKLYHLGLTFSELEDEWPSPAESGLQSKSDASLFEQFFRGRATPDLVRISWTDYTAMPRMRMVPWRKFKELVEDGRPTDIGITKASLGLLQNDWMAPGISCTGEYRLHADFSSLREGPIPGHANMFGEFREKDGSRVQLCPRTQLHRAVEMAKEEGLEYLLGFEIEFVLLERLDASHAPKKFDTLADYGHAWSLSRCFADPKIATLLRDVVAALDDMGIYVEQLHPEAALGQFELILPPLTPVEAVDTLVHTRDVVAALATAAGYKFTLHPKPFAQTCGTAAHVHISIASARGADRRVYESFYAGVLAHLRAINAFTYSSPASYERVVDGAWAGGRWVTWGTQNREVPLRKIEGSHWELKCMDGLANPYLALAAVLLAGANGVVHGQQMTWADCEVDPAQLSENDKKELGITEMMPGSVEEALQALEEDEELTRLLGSALVKRYINVKEFELKYLMGMSDDEMRQWIMERY